MNTTLTTAAAQTTTPGISTEIAELMEDLTGFHPAVDRVVSTIGDLLTAGMNADRSMCAVAAIGAFDQGNIHVLLALVLQQIANPDANPALADLPDDRKQTLRRLGSEYVAALDYDHPTQVASEIAGAIGGTL
ncbi:hypothetical protein AB0454_35590 [Streptomyces sp. NPDC093509]|uniref:hypothetical protein n=1 Tax=Streptomyces sp. NPDC093509 TaxID=3154982 RepID=UPI00344B0541